MSTHSKNLAEPEETQQFPGITADLVDLGDVTVGRYRAEPGWRWSTHVRPQVGGDSCQARHVGVVVTGRLGIRLEDGTSFELGPYDVFDIPPGHDGYVIGHEPVETIEWSGTRAFTGFRGSHDRALATLLFTDLVASTETAARVGDGAWRAMLSGHFEAARAEFQRFRGREVKTTGDGLLATFDGPAQAVRCAAAVRRAAARDGLQIRAAVHVGEVEMVADDLRGVAVHEAARIMAQAGDNEILVSETTRALAMTSGLAFEDRGTHALKGLDGEWHLFVYTEAGPSG
jgi:class 3 adenylate cyclase